MKKAILYIFTLLLTATACQKQETEGRIPVGISDEKIYFDCGSGQSIAVSVECNGEWKIEGMTEGMKTWLESDAVKGKGNSVVNFKTIELNPYDEKRMAVLNFKTKTDSCSLVVTQISDPERTISLSEDLLEFGGALDSRTVEVFTSKSWTVDSAVPSWLSLDKTAGEGAASVKISTVEVNEEIDTRSCELEFRIDRVHAAKLLVTQAPGIELKIDVSSLEFSSAGSETQQMNVSCNSATKEWTVEGYDAQVQTWLSLDVTKGIGDKTLTFKTLGKNVDLTKIARMQIRLDAKRYLDFTVTQASGLEISVDPSSIAFDGNEASSKTAVVSTNTDKYEWTIEGYTAEVQEWLTIDVLKAAGLSTALTLSTLGPNRSGTVRNAELTFKLSEGVQARLEVSQDIKKAGLKIISWSGVSGTQTITAPAGKDYNYFPYTTGTDPSKNPVWTDGPDGEVMFTGYFKATRDYIFKMDSEATVGESYTFEIGPSTEEEKCFYGNLKLHGYIGYRTRNVYVKTPAIPNYKLTHVKILCGNAADKANSVTVGTDKSIKSTTPATAANVQEGKALITLGKPSPADISLTQTTVGTSYYIFVVQDRLITGLTFTYTEVE